ncbi:MAG: T9SS sorting signal type C domain-containing protein [Flavobacterium sp.]
MKKTLLILMLMPLCALAQNALAVWNTTAAPSGANVNSNITASALSSSGISVSTDTNQNQWEASGLYLSNLHTGSSSATIITSRYLEFAIVPKANYQAAPSQFSFTYYSPGDAGAKKMQAQWTSNGTTWTNLTNAAVSNQTEIALTQNAQATVTLNFAAGVNILPAQTLKIRVYLYDLNNDYYSKFFLRTKTYSSEDGPKLTGTASSYSNVLLATNDSYTVNINQATVLTVTSNDVAGAAPINAISIVSPVTNGSTSINTANKTITYTPNADYVGNDSFTYKISNGTDPDKTATVSITVQGVTPTGSLNGTYQIGTLGHFTTITAAATYLNNNGVSGPVKFLLRNDVYNNASGETFPIAINSLSGSSATNTVTFKPAPYKNVRIEAFRDAVTGSYTGVPSVFKFNGTDNIVFDGSNTTNGTTRNLTIVNSSFGGGDDHTNDYIARTVLWFATPDGNNGCENIKVKYTGIKQTWKNTADNFCVGIYAGNSALGGNNSLSTGESYTAHKNIWITGNDFMNVKQGIYINGNSGAPAQNIYIHQNDLGAENNTESIIQPCALRHVNGFEFTENQIYRLYRNTAAASLVSSGIYVSGNSQNGLIAKNDMKDLTKTLDEGIWFAGIVLDSDIQGNNNITVANNFILNVSCNNASNYKGNGHGIIVVKGKGYSIYHNTVVLNTSQTGGGIGYSAALYVDSGSSLDVRNNIFVNNQANTQTRRTALAAKTTQQGMNQMFTFLDYNSLYSTDKLTFVANQWTVGDIESWGSPDYLTTLSAWQSLTGKDGNSVNFNPVFASATDLHLAEGNSAIDNEGVKINAVPKDIDGQLRNSTKPTIGADEYGDAEIPEPGETNAGIYCTSSTTYKNGVWTNGTPTADKDVIFESDFTQTGGSLYACSIFVKGNAKVNFISHSNAIVTHAVNVANTATFTFESGSALRQIENTANTGKVIIKRNSSLLKRLDYTLWSSPVKDQKLKTFSPQTMTDRFYTYNTPTDQYNAIATNLVATTPFTAAKGYLIRMPNSYSTSGYNQGTTAIVWPGVFTGTPHNGTIRIPLTYGKYTNGVADANGTVKQYNAIGNPYPSPINITDFLTENADVIDGTLYMWRKTNDYTKSSYWTVNKSGATANAAPGGINDLVNYPHAIDPTGLINTGQGFIVKALGTNKEVVFKNNMRRSETFDNFFRMSNPESQVDEIIAPTGLPNASRVWLNVENSAGTFAQALITYTDVATTGYDNGFDGEALLDGGVSLYSLMPDYKLAIQSRPAFTDADVVPMGFKTTVSGTFEVKIYEMDGLFATGQAVYLKDNTTGTMHNLQNGNYTFTSEIGTFDNRFEVHYTTDSALGTDNPQVAAKDIIVYGFDKQVKVKSTETIASVQVYDILGKLVYEKKNIGADEFSSSTLGTAQQVLVVKVMLESGQAVSKKIMMN